MSDMEALAALASLLSGFSLAVMIPAWIIVHVIYRAAQSGTAKEEE